MIFLLTYIIYEAKFIDEFVKLRLEQAESTDNKAVVIDPRLESIVMGMFERCYAYGHLLFLSSFLLSAFLIT